jgi:hypothetical protein
MNTVVTFVQAHYLLIGGVLLLVFKCSANALPPKGEPFVFSQWFMETWREVAQQAPTKLTDNQLAILKNAGQPVK